jgi:hypothetical protein
MRPPENSSELTAAQCQEILEHIGPMLLYLRKLLNRVEQLHFPADDQFRREVQEAYNDVHNLRVGLHYMTCNAMKRERDANLPKSPTGNYELYRRKRKG